MAWQIAGVLNEWDRTWVATIRKLVIGLVVLVAAIVLLLVSLYLDFRIRAEPYAGGDALPPTAIVFGGSHDRIYLAMDLLDRGLVDQVYITGANRPGGIRRDTFADDYNLPPGARRKLETGRVIFAAEATNTLENAVEASCWLRDHPEITSVTLITSRWHMPRASLALERALTRSVRIVRFPSQPQLVKYWFRDMWREETEKYLATWFGALLPIGPWGEAQQVCKSTSGNG